VSSAKAEQGGSFSEQERAAMKQRAAELRAEGRRGGRSKAAAAEQDLLAAIAKMPEPDRSLAERIHGLVIAAAPDLAPKLWYGQPAYARSGKVVCFFRSGQADGARYSAFGFNDEAKLDVDGGFWPTSFALTADMGEAAEAEITRLVAKAVS
jgi:uncharacterized protein YdhG (YjbR/CyaY superfamily)